MEQLDKAGSQLAESIRRFLPVVACFLIATAGTCDEIPPGTRESAERGEADSQWLMGLHYNYGEGVPQDYKESVKWYRKAAEQGYAGAQYCLGVLYNQGEGVPQDYKESAKWYRKAAEQGYAGAQYGLGRLYN
ncbi:sel1 repeat family protein [bacterium]|nr:sel1 repeat family protein [bacterium]